MFQFKVHKCLPIRNRDFYFIIIERTLAPQTFASFLCLFNSFLGIFFYIISKEFDIVYMCYVFPTQTTRSEFDDSQFQVRRRYNDFLWLRQKLEESYPTHLVPVSK